MGNNLPKKYYFGFYFKGYHLWDLLESTLQKPQAFFRPCEKESVWLRDILVDYEFPRSKNRAKLSFFELNYNEVQHLFQPSISTLSGLKYGNLCIPLVAIEKDIIDDIRNTINSRYPSTHMSQQHYMHYVSEFLFAYEPHLKILNKDFNIAINQL